MKSRESLGTKGTRLLVSSSATSTETGPSAPGHKGIERRSSYLSTSPRTVKAAAVYDYCSSSQSCPPREVRTVPPARNPPVKYQCACCKKNLDSRTEFDLVTRQFERKVKEMHH